MRSFLNQVATTICIGWLFLVVLGSAQAQEGKPDSTDPESAGPTLEDLSDEGRQVAARLNATVEPGSEARAMFEAILGGSQLGSDEGWFPQAVSQTLIDWTSARSLFDKD